MTAADALTVFGSTIPFKYFTTGNEYVDAVFSYNRTVTQTPYRVDTAGGSYTYEGSVWLEYLYSAGPDISTNPQYISVDIQPQYSLFDTQQIHTCIACSTADSPSTIFQSPAWDWYFNGQTYHIENSDTTSDTTRKANFTVDDWQYTFVCADLSSASVGSGYSYRATFSGNSFRGYRMRLMIAVPYLSSGGSGGSGTFTTDSGGGGGGGDTYTVIVNVDNSGVESRLDDVNSGIADINSAIYGQGSETMPYLDSMDTPSFHFDGSTIDDVNDTLQQVPQEFAAAGFWWELAFNVLHLDSPFWAIVPLVCILALLRYVVWRG